MEISFCSHPNTNEVIATRFGTWHDSWAVVACAKFCCDLIISNWIRSKWNFRWIWIVMEKSLVKWVPGINITRYLSRISKWHSKRYSKSTFTSSIWEKSNNDIAKYHPANHKIPVYSNKMRKFDMWTLSWQALWQFPLHIITAHIITAQAVAVGCVWCSWWQFSTFQCRLASLWIMWLCGYRDMHRIDFGIEMWYQYWYQYWKICNDIHP